MGRSAELRPFLNLLYRLDRRKLEWFDNAMFRSEGVCDPRLCLVNDCTSAKNAGHRPMRIKLINRITQPRTRVEQLCPPCSGLKLAKAGLIRRCF